VFKNLRKFNHLGFVHVAIWLFIQLSMTGVFSPANAAINGDLTISGASSTVVICTSTGLKRITLNADGTLPPDAPDINSPCQWCRHFGNLPPLASAMDWQGIPVRLTSTVIWFPGSEKHISKSTAIHFQGRAPPF